MTEEKAVVFGVPKRYEELDFMDDFLFCKILTANLDLCRELLEIIMDIKIHKVELAESQKEWKVEYMTLLMREQEIMEKGIERGRIEGHREGRTEERN